MPNFDPSAYGLRAEQGVRIALPDSDATLTLGRSLAERLRPGDFLGLVGNLGAGKTTLMQGLVEALDPELEALSPTYTLLNVYDSEPPVFHFDLYRLENVDDLETVGYWDYVDAEDGIACVEWLDRVPEAWPERGTILVLEHEGDHRIAHLFSNALSFETLQVLAGAGPA